MKSILYIVLFLIGFHAAGQAKKVCITVDDLPTVTYGDKDASMRLQIIQRLLKVFDDNNIPAIGYVNEGKLYNEGVLEVGQVNLLEHWLKNGYELGNHTFSHLNYHQTSFQVYTADILRGEKLIKQLAKKYDSEVRYFRHPYLRIGLNKSQADSLKTFLTENNYTEAPVTIDNDDYLFAKAYGKAFNKGDSTLMKKIGTAYLSYMTDKLHFYERISTELFGRDIQHILLVHASLLNADYLGELMKIYKQNNYSFISQTAVLNDPVYKHEITRYRDWGISWVDRWALTRGVNSGFFKGDPETPEFIIELSR